MFSNTKCPPFSDSNGLISKKNTGALFKERLLDAVYEHVPYRWMAGR
jgi:hypothetical protein